MHLMILVSLLKNQGNHAKVDPKHNKIGSKPPTTIKGMYEIGGDVIFYKRTLLNSILITCS